jgi:hypothetical protein
MQADAAKTTAPIHRGGIDTLFVSRLSFIVFRKTTNDQRTTTPKCFLAKVWKLLIQMFANS